MNEFAKLKKLGLNNLLKRGTFTTKDIIDEGKRLGYITCGKSRMWFRNFIIDHKDVSIIDKDTYQSLKGVGIFGIKNKARFQTDGYLTHIFYLSIITLLIIAIICK